MQDVKKIDVYEVLKNLSSLCKVGKFTFEEHIYLQDGLEEINARLNELDDLKKPHSIKEKAKE